MRINGLLLFITLSAGAADASATEQWKGTATPETSAACVARLKKSPADCFVLHAKFSLEICRTQAHTALSRLQARMLLPGVDQSSGADEDCSCTNGSVTAVIADHYQATLRQFAKNRAAQDRTKDYYAAWRAAMSSLLPGASESSPAYDTRTGRQAADLDALGERLKLEQ
jgi:hypothetical protein